LGQRSRRPLRSEGDSGLKHALNVAGTVQHPNDLNSIFNWPVEHKILGEAY